MRRLRPEWPRGIPAQCASMQRLAEACWRQEPQDRWGRLCANAGRQEGGEGAVAVGGLLCGNACSWLKTFCAQLLT